MRWQHQTWFIRHYTIPLEWKTTLEDEDAYRRLETACSVNLSDESGMKITMRKSLSQKNQKPQIQRSCNPSKSLASEIQRNLTFQHKRLH